MLMSNNKGISLEKCMGKYVFKFLNGFIEIPDQNGAYVIASGCGSGKTTNIVNLIKTDYNEGILYSAFTIEECKRMYDLVISEVVNKGYGLTKDDIVVLMNEQYDGVDMDKWNINPDYIKDKKVVICTHHKFLNVYPELLLSTSFNYHKILDGCDYYDPLEFISGKYEGATKILLPRKWVLIDELPDVSNGFKVRIPWSTFVLLSESSYDDIDKRLILSKPSLGRLNHMFNALSNKLIPDIGNDPKSYKRNFIFSSIYHNHEIYKNYFEKKASKDLKRLDPYITIGFTISSLIRPDMKMRLVLFEGTGDLSMYINPNSTGSNKFNVLTFNNKYNSDINIDKFQFNTIRYLNKLKTKRITPEENIASLEYNVSMLYRIINKGFRTLIITWKGFKNIDDGNGDSYDIGESLPEYYKRRLIESGIDISRFSIIHYMSGLDRATNEFKDYDQVVFLGEFHVPEDIVDNFRMIMKVDTSNRQYLLYQLVQVICRTRIRNHRSEPINVYFSSDWKDDIIIDLYKYLTGNSGYVLKEPYTGNLPVFKKKFEDHIIKLISYFGDEFRYALIERKYYRCTIDLDTIYELIPMSERKVKKYYPLINYLRSLLIELTIKSENNNQYTKNRGV